MTTYDPDLHHDVVGARGEQNRKYYPVNKLLTLLDYIGAITVVQQDTAPSDTTVIWNDLTLPESDNGTAKVYSGGSWVPLTPTLFGVHIAASSTVLWGNISGTLSNQTDLQTALDAKQAADADLTSWAAVTRASGFDTFAATPNSANLRALLTDETGSGGAAVFATGPTISDPDFTGLTDIQQGFAFTGDISPSQITADQNDYAPTGFSTASVLRLSSDASRNITGLAGGSDGLVKLIWNVGAQNIVLKDESASSTAANRFALSADVTIGADSGVLIQYDATSSRWRLLGGSGGGGDVTAAANLTDNAIVRGDGGAKGVQTSTVLIDDNGEIDMNGNNIIFDDNTGITDDSGNELLWFQKTASATNYVEIENSTVYPTIRAAGDGANVGLTIASKGVNPITFVVNSATVLSLTDGGQLSTPAIALSPGSGFPHVSLAAKTLLGTLEAGALEYDGEGLYATMEPNMGRGVVDTELFACISADYTLTNTSDPQRAFDIATNGAVAVAASTLYFFEAQFFVDSMSATTGNLGFDLLGSGTATLTSIMYSALGADGNVTTAGGVAATIHISEASASGVPITTSATNTRCAVYIKGAFRTNAAGTIIPTIDLSHAAAAVVNANSFFRMWPVGTSSTESQGTWT